MNILKLKLSPLILGFLLYLLLQGCISSPNIELTATNTPVLPTTSYNLATQPIVQATLIPNKTSITLNSVALTATVTPTQTLFPNAVCKYKETAPVPLFWSHRITQTEQFLDFTVTPTRTTQGGKMTLTWTTTQDVDQAVMCYMTNLKPDRSACCELPLNGSQVITTDQDATVYKFALWAGNSKNVVVSVKYGCIDVSDWFFKNPPRGCAAAPPIHSRAVAQQFEHGLMIWVKEINRIIIFFDDHTSWAREIPLRLKPGASGDHRVDQVPSGFFQPVDNFGLIWRGEVVDAEYIRKSLGWALAPEFEFDTIYQEGIYSIWDFSDFLRWPDGRIIHYYDYEFITRSWDEWSSSP